VDPNRTRPRAGLATALLLGHIAAGREEAHRRAALVQSREGLTSGKPERCVTPAERREELRAGVGLKESREGIRVRLDQEEPYEKEASASAIRCTSGNSTGEIALDTLPACCAGPLRRIRRSQEVNVRGLGCAVFAGGTTVIDLQNTSRHAVGCRL
jgi:hypothetical protein